MIDLRSDSDTVTRLTPAMGQAMATTDIHRALERIACSIATPCVAS